MKLILFTTLFCCFATRYVNSEEIIRLTSIISDQTSVTGNVEIFNAGEWQPLCGRLWGHTDADIVCKTVGFAKGAIGNPRHPIPGEESKQKHWYYLFEGLSCSGKESSVTECPNWNKSTPGIRNCSVGRAAAQCER